MVSWGGFESELIVEARRIFLHMSDDRSYACGLSNGPAAEEGILEERSADSSALMPHVNRQPRQHQNWHRPFSRLALQQSLSCVRRLDLRNGKGVIADYRASVKGDEGASRLSCLCMSRIAVQPAVQGLVPAAKICEIVLPA